MKGSKRKIMKKGEQDGERKRVKGELKETSRLCTSVPDTSYTDRNKKKSCYFLDIVCFSDMTFVYPGLKLLKEFSLAAEQSKAV